MRAIASQYAVIQTQVDKADQGMNPLGLAKGVVPFDIDPFLLTPAPTRQTKTHFEQIYDRSLAALENARTVFDYATQYTLMLRGNEDDLTTFRRGIKEQERGYWNRLIEIFGYPYDGDIGPGGTYASGYDGPDWIHFMYVDQTDLTGEKLYTEQVPYKVTFNFEKKDGDDYAFDELLSFDKKNVSEQVDSNGSIVEITYHINEDNPWFDKPAGWGKRRAPGEIQMSLSGLIQAHANYQRALTELEGQLGVMAASMDILEAKYGVFKHQIEVKDSASGTVKDLNTAMTVLFGIQKALNLAGVTIKNGFLAAAEGMPKIIGFSSDLTSIPRSGFLIAGGVGMAICRVAEDVLAVVERGLGVGKEHTLMARDRKLFIDDARFEVQQMVKELECMESDARAKLQEIYMLREVIHQALGRYQAALAQGERLLTERELFRKRTAAIVQDYRYQDMGFRIFRNDAVQKYRATFDLAARYAYLAATAYDYETNLLGSDGNSGSIFLTDIVKQRSPGVIMGDKPVVGKRGLADPLARFSQNFDVYKGQLGFNNPQIETNRFSLRRELFRIKDTSDQVWRDELQKWRVDNLLDFPPFKRFCRPFADESRGAQPGIVIPFSTEVLFGYNFFGWPLGGGDSAYDPTNFATKVRSVGIWFSGYDSTGLSSTPRIYLIQVGADVLRSPSADGFATREWDVVDQKLPAPFLVGESDLKAETWIPINDTLSGQLSETRRFSSFRAYPDNQASSEAETIAAESTMDSRLIGRSVWNTQWMLIIPGGTLFADPDAGLDAFINNVSDIKLFFQTYSYSGN